MSVNPELSAGLSVYAEAEVIKATVAVATEEAGEESE